MQSPTRIDSRAAPELATNRAEIDGKPGNSGSLLLTVAEAAVQLRIGRTLAYELANVYLETGGREGLPAIRIGRCLRVPRARLLAFIDAELTSVHSKITDATVSAASASREGETCE